MSKDKNKIIAVIWDYDGTIVDTAQKNLNVTKKIVEKISGKGAENFPALRSLENYKQSHLESANWRHFYSVQFGFDENEVDEAGRIWTEYQLNDKTPAPLFEGIDFVIKNLKNYPQGVVSQNSRSNMIKKLKEHGLDQYFDCLVGYEEVDIKKQKPDPAGMLICINKLAENSSGAIFYIGDHETDVQCVNNTNNVLMREKRNIKVVSLGAQYGSYNIGMKWNFQPDFEVNKVGEILEIVENYR